MAELLPNKNEKEESFHAVTSPVCKNPQIYKMQVKKVITAEHKAMNSNFLAEQ
tara:strand:- start:205 stop:363 length:159 start_codon:yes stop_codon:yes gene_type:complete